MHFFQYKQNKLYAEEVPVEKIAEEVGTPVYIYSYKTIQRHFQVFQKAFAKAKHLICFSMKCNSNLAILRIIANEGGGVDIVSGGELYRALQAGVDPQKIRREAGDGSGCGHGAGLMGQVGMLRGRWFVVRRHSGRSEA